MDKHGPILAKAALAAALVVVTTTGTGLAAPISSTSSPASRDAALPATRGAVQLAQSGGTEPRELQPRYEPVPPQPKSSYNNEYIFGLTRGVAESTMHPAAKVLIFPLTVPLDIVFLPFEAIGGFFGS